MSSADVADVTGLVNQAHSDSAVGTEEPATQTVAALTNSSETLLAETPPTSLADASASDDLIERPSEDTTPSNPLARVDACPTSETESDICTDRYLWSLYQRAPKEDSIVNRETRTVTIKRKGKLITAKKVFAVAAAEDFSWKDPKAAEAANMTLMTYVIGGMDRDFKQKLSHLLRSAEDAGLAPGITSAFRDDYRQSIANGLKAANNRSYHGGSLRGGYGHGLAADIVSVNGETREQRLTSSRLLWKWVDAHGRDFGLGRPYLGKDPMHVAPVDGQEWAVHRLRKPDQTPSPIKPAA